MHRGEELLVCGDDEWSIAAHYVEPSTESLLGQCDAGLLQGGPGSVRALTKPGRKADRYAALLAPI